MYYANLKLESIYYFCEIDYKHKTEQWAPVVNYEGVYEVSDLGRVKSLNRSIIRNSNLSDLKTKILKQGSNGKYLICGLSKNEISKSVTVSTLLAMAFLNHTLGNRNIVVDHKNNVKTDNRLINLQIISFRHNISKDRKNKEGVFTGVRKRPNKNRWYSMIRINKKSVYLGDFDTKELASNAYQDKLKTLNEYNP